MTRSSGRRTTTAAVAAVALVLAVASAAHAGEPCVLAPARSGAIGAWLLAAADPDADARLGFVGDGSPVDALAAIRRGTRPGRASAFELVASGDGVIDLHKRGSSRRGERRYLAAVLRVSQPSRLLVVVGADDGVEAAVDGKKVFARKLKRPPGLDDDAFEVDLSPGDHSLVFRLEQHAGPWAFRARILDAGDGLPPRHASFLLPGVAASDALLGQLARTEVSIDVTKEGYRPRARVSFPAGMPLGISNHVRVRAQLEATQRHQKALFDIQAGAIPQSDRSVFDLEVTLPRLSASEVEHDSQGRDVVLEVTAGHHRAEHRRRLYPLVRNVIAKADAALRSWPTDAPGEPVGAGNVTKSSVELARSRLHRFLSNGPRDQTAMLDEASRLDAWLGLLAQGVDPVTASTGPARLAYRSQLDDKLHAFGLYAPTRRPDVKYPLVVVLHGLNGQPMQVLQSFFGREVRGRKDNWEDLYTVELPRLDAFVLAPSGFGNLSYREAGEVDVMTLVDWVTKTFPIDQRRIYVTGPSMGGTGAASIALRHPDRFAAAAPLCGYHTYAIRRDMQGRPLRPWERILGQFWSNVSWAENGRQLPMYVVHGTQDLPTQYSGALIDRYKRLGYPMLNEHPEAGHNVWQMTYENFKAYRWLSRHERDPEPPRVTFKTASLRYDTHAWVQVLELEEHLAWGEVDARIAKGNVLVVRTDGMKALRLTPPPKHLVEGTPIRLTIDGQSFEAAGTIELHKTDGGWALGSAKENAGVAKRPGLSGPIRDVFLGPLTFVYGTKDPALTRIQHEIALAFAQPSGGIEGRWPIIADVDVDEATASARSLFLIGSARSNAYVGRIDQRLPIRLEGHEIIAGNSRFGGDDVGAMFVHPNPEHPERYVVVLQAPTPAGLLRALSLPKMLPDFVVYDAAVAPARGEMVLGVAKLRAGGMFDDRWQLPLAPGTPY